MDHVFKGEMLIRLRKIEGQIKGISKMIDEEKYCVDILTQIAAVKAALNSVGGKLIENHTKHCVVTGLKGDNPDKVIDELVGILKKFAK